MKYDIDLCMADLNRIIQKYMYHVIYEGIPPGMPGNDLPGLMGLGVAYDEVGNHRILQRFDYPAVTGLAPDRDRIRAHLRILHSDLMRNYSVTFEQFNNGVRRLSCDELETPAVESWPRVFGIVGTAEAIAEARKRGYNPALAGMLRFRSVK